MHISQPLSLELLRDMTLDLAERARELSELRQQLREAESRLLRSTRQPWQLAYAAA